MPESRHDLPLVLVGHTWKGRSEFEDQKVAALNDLGYASVTDDVIQTAFGKFKILADKKKHMLTWIADFRPGNLISGAEFCVESNVEVEIMRIVHLDLKNRRKK